MPLYAAVKQKDKKKIKYRVATPQIPNEQLPNEITNVALKFYFIYQLQKIENPFIRTFQNVPLQVLTLYKVNLFIVYDYVYTCIIIVLIAVFNKLNLLVHVNAFFDVIF